MSPRREGGTGRRRRQGFTAQEQRTSRRGIMNALVGWVFAHAVTAFPESRRAENEGAGWGDAGCSRALGCDSGANRPRSS